VDDIIIMSRATFQEWWEIDKVLKLFCSASGLKINIIKSTFHHEGLSELELDPFKSLYPYNFSELAIGFKYLGVFIKTGTHRIEDWHWLIRKMEKKIDNWCYRWLSLGVDLFL
jgi:hypothetical protein